MLSDIDKYILANIFYTQITDLLTLNRVVDSLNDIKSSVYDQIIIQQLFMINVVIFVNKYLNETKLDNLEESLKVFNFDLQKKVLEIYNKTSSQIENLELNDLQIKLLYANKLLLYPLSLQVVSIVNSNPIYINSLNYNNSVKYYVLTKFINNLVKNNQNLNFIDLTELALSNNKELITKIAVDYLLNIENPIFPNILADYLF